MESEENWKKDRPVPNSVVEKSVESVEVYMLRNKKFKIYVNYRNDKRLFFVCWDLNLSGIYDNI